ncbi:MAG TPA: gluconokinase [Pyrinomonadaceae bacterium]
MSSVLDEVADRFEPSPEFVSVMPQEKRAVVLGLDVGTSGVRAAMFDEHGSEIPGARAQNSRDLSTHSGLAEMDPEQAFKLVVQTIDDLLSLTNSIGSRIELISISCFWHSLLGVDSTGSPTTSILGWGDTRSIGITKKLRERLNEKEIHARTGCRFHPSYWPAKLLWLRSENTKAFQDTRCWLGFGEYLSLRLFGNKANSVSMASATGLFNQQTKDWDRELIQALDISPATLPEIALANRTGDRLVERFAVRWPQLSEAYLCPAIGDGAANNIGAGCVGRESAALMVGTSGALRVLYKDDAPSELSDALWCYRVDRSRVVVGGALSDGGGLYRWLTEALAFDGVSDEALEASLAKMEPDAHGLTILPFWAGERSTGWNPNARGAILGLSMQTEPIEIVRAAMESVAYRFALILDALDKITIITSLVASGNALRASQVWVQILADVLNRPVMLAGSPEASMRGAALLALEAAGKIESIEEFSIPAETVFEPDASRHGRYREGLLRQQQYYDALFNRER